jgi:AraC-like DNA-binding protein
MIPSQEPGVRLHERAPAELAADPVIGYQRGRRWAYFAFDEVSFGYALWGRPEPGDVETLTCLWRTCGERNRAPHTILADLSGLDGLDADVFHVLTRYIAEDAAILSRVVTRAALVLPRGLVGAAVGGFFAVQPAPFPVTTHPTPLEALNDLGPFAVERAKGVGALLGTLSSATDELEDLDTYLRNHPEATSLSEVSRALGTSSRTLQRRMAGSNASFFERLRRARVARAREMLRDRSRTITEVALSLGFRTTQHFSASFRAETGSSPTAFRSRAASE